MSHTPFCHMHRICPTTHAWGCTGAKDRYLICPGHSTETFNKGRGRCGLGSVWSFFKALEAILIHAFRWIRALTHLTVAPAPP